MTANLTSVAQALEKMFRNREIKGYVMINGKPEVVLAKDESVAAKLAELLKDVPNKERIIKLE